MIDEMSGSERATMGRLFDRFPSRAPVDAVDVLAEIRRAVVEERKAKTAAVDLLREVARVANDPATIEDHTGAVNWLLDFANRADVVALLAPPVQP